jgi:hypothetical protein
MKQRQLLRQVRELQIRNLAHYSSLKQIAEQRRKCFLIANWVAYHVAAAKYYDFYLFHSQYELFLI